MIYLHVTRCEECGKEFQYKSHHASTRNYCSRACRTKAARKNRQIGREAELRYYHEKWGEKEAIA